MKTKPLLDRVPYPDTPYDLTSGCCYPFPRASLTPTPTHQDEIYTMQHSLNRDLGWDLGSVTALPLPSPQADLGEGRRNAHSLTSLEIL